MSANDFTPSNNVIFEPFQWHREETENAMLPGGAVMRFTGAVKDLSLGAMTILEILERDELAEEGGDPKILNKCDASRLMRIAIASLRLLGEDADEITEWAYEHHTPEGKQERQEAA